MRRGDAAFHQLVLVTRRQNAVIPAKAGIQSGHQIAHLSTAGFRPSPE